jgi:hypothetical protein
MPCICWVVISSEQVAGINTSGPARNGGPKKAPRVFRMRQRREPKPTRRGDQALCSMIGFVFGLRIDHEGLTMIHSSRSSTSSRIIRRTSGHLSPKIQP